MSRQPIIHCLKIGPYQVNTYVVACPETQKGLIIDPGGEPDRIIDTIETAQIEPLFILNTHGHQDHVTANAALADHYRIDIAMHLSDIDFFQKHMAFRGKEMLKNYQAGRVLKDHDRLLAGKLEINVIHTPGHTPGSVCFKMETCLFSGDTLFVGNAGRTDLPGGDIDVLIHSIHSRLTTLPDDTILYPGHDYGSTPVSTIGREKKENLYITDFI